MDLCAGRILRTHCGRQQDSQIEAFTGYRVAISMTSNPNTPGIGLRLAHLAEMVATRPAAGWLEVHPDRLNLKRVRGLAARLKPIFVSGHLAWSTYGNEYLNDLFPLPYNEESLQLVSTHISYVQDTLGKPYLIENPSSYVGFRSSTMKETDFLSEIVRRTGCQLLCDVSNVVVSAHNMVYDAYQYIDNFPADAIREIHLGGYTPEKDEATPGAELLIDTHAAAIADPSWDLYAYALRRFGPKATLVRGASEIPPIGTLLGQADYARKIAQGVTKGVGEPANV